MIAPEIISQPISAEKVMSVPYLLFVIFAILIRVNSVILQDLVNYIPGSDSTISWSSNNSNPTFQSILTAYLLMSLLLSPSYAIPLNQIKEQLANKAARIGSTESILGQSSTRILYGCVAKRLIKVDRGSGEQIVKFDIQ